LITPEPIEFGHSSNDPVDLAFAQCALDKKSHISAPGELACFLPMQIFAGSAQQCDTPALQTSLSVS
jgi:PTS system ascorbate-specific IIA component